MGNRRFRVKKRHPKDFPKKYGPNRLPKAPKTKTNGEMGWKPRLLEKHSAQAQITHRDHDDQSLRP